MIKLYRSKIGAGVVFFVAFVFGFVAFNLFLAEISAITVLSLLVPLAFVGAILFSIRYFIDLDKQVLTVKVAFVQIAVIAIPTIRKIEKTNTWLSSPAASLDRIEVFYNKFDSVIISPNRRAEFIADLLQINSQIEVDLAAHSG